MGVVWALISVLLVSAAQLSLRHAVLLLPPLASGWPFFSQLLHFGPGTLALAAGLCAYLVSMVCWYFSLQRLPLSRAYCLLSLSYVLVWAAAIALPGWHGVFSWRALLGVCAIVAGVLVIFLPPRGG